MSETRTLVNPKNGATIETHLMDDEAAEICRGLNGEFPNSLAEKAGRYRLSEAQEFWLHKLALEATRPAAPAAAGVEVRANEGAGAMVAPAAAGGELARTLTALAAEIESGVRDPFAEPEPEVIMPGPIRVLHNESRETRFQDDDDPDPKDLRLVAVVATNDLDTAYSLTQNITDRWTRNAGVTKVGDAEAFRSTSMGDVLEIGGRFYLVCSVGFRELGWEPTAPGQVGLAPEDLSVGHGDCGSCGQAMFRYEARDFGYCTECFENPGLRARVAR